MNHYNEKGEYEVSPEIAEILRNGYTVKKLDTPKLVTAKEARKQIEINRDTTIIKRINDAISHNCYSIDINRWDLSSEMRSTLESLGYGVREYNSGNYEVSW